MGFKLKRLVKSAKKTIKTAGRVGAKVVKYAAPVVGTALLGPLGGLAGTGLAGLASQVGPNKSRSAALKRTLIYGGGVTAVGSALGLISGAGIGASGVSSLGRIFGGGAPEPQPKPEDNDLLASMDFGYGPVGSAAAAAVRNDPNAKNTGLENALFSGIGGFLGNQNGPSGLEGSGARAGGTLGSEGGGVFSPGGLLAGLQPEEKPGLPLLPLLALGGVVLFLVARRKG